jgi:hypothetical protein
MKLSKDVLIDKSFMKRERWGFALIPVQIIYTSLGNRSMSLASMLQGKFR